MKKTVITVVGDIDGLQDFLKINPSGPSGELFSAKTVTVKRDFRDPNEEQDDIPRKAERKNPYKAGLCEISGLVRRARTELADGNVRNVSITLGRIANAIDRETNK